MAGNDPKDKTQNFRRRLLLRLVVCIIIGLLGIGFRFSGIHSAPIVSLFIFGGSVVAAAFLLAWTAETLQLDISSGLAMAILALIAVMPEYAVDFIFAYKAAAHPEYTELAAANMTGANRLLIGVGWSLVVLLSTMVWRKSKELKANKDPRTFSVSLDPSHSVEFVILLIATIWSLSMPLLHRIAPWHGVGMLAIFAFYIWRLRGNPAEEPDLHGVAFILGQLPKAKRRIVVFTLLGFAAGILGAAAHPFVEALLRTGKQLKLDAFLLAQWIAPLASESPELLVAIIFSLRGHGQAGMAALLSSKVNQWTLLVGTLPFVYSAGMRKFVSLPLGGRQTEELVLTAAQGLLGVSVLANGRMERWEAGLMLGLFLIQIPFPQPMIRYAMSALYFALALILFVRARKDLRRHFVYVFGKREARTTQA